MKNIRDLSAVFIFSALMCFVGTVGISPAGADPIQACLDKISAAASARSATNTAVTPSNATVTFDHVPSGELFGRCDERGSLDAVKRALSLQVARCAQTRPFDKQTFKLGCQSLQRSEWCSDSSRQMLAIANASADFATFLKRVRTEFDWYKSSGMNLATTDGKYTKGETQFTGYFTPVIKASRVKTARFKFPIYAQPKDLVQIPDSSPANCGFNSVGKPLKWCRRLPNGTYARFFTRAEIDAGALNGRGLEIAYLEDALEIAFIMIQGSATLEVDHADGSKEMIRANFAAKNGRTLQMLGRVVKCDGGDKEDYSSMHGIKEYLRARPARIAQLMNYDQSYIFFREMKDGPLGSEDVPVTAFHSVAVDRSLVPPGAALLLDIEKSKSAGAASCPRLTTFALAQDTGGAIRGAHVDWYVGEGDRAAQLANNFDNAGSYYVAVPRGAGRPIAGCR